MSENEVISALSYFLIMFGLSMGANYVIYCKPWKDPMTYDLYVLIGSVSAVALGVCFLNV